METTRQQLELLQNKVTFIALERLILLVLYFLFVFVSRMYINDRGKQLQIDWLHLHYWRMATFFFGPLVPILFYFWSQKYIKK